MYSTTETKATSRNDLSSREAVFHYSKPDYPAYSSSRRHIIRFRMPSFAISHERKEAASHDLHSVSLRCCFSLSESIQYFVEFFLTELDSVDRSTDISGSVSLETDILESRYLGAVDRRYILDCHGIEIQ